MPLNETDYLQHLNLEQNKAVITTEGPLLVLAGAGTGKTRVLTARITHLLKMGLAHPGQILAVTFTNKAAKEMQQRVISMLNTPVDGMWLGTFHAIAARILRRHSEQVGLQPQFIIIDQDDQIRLLKTLLQEFGFDEKNHPAKYLAAIINQWKDKGLSPDKVASSEIPSFAGGKGVVLYKAYQSRLQMINAVDFGDLLLHNVQLFSTSPSILAEYQQRFRYILVDEYQDTNIAQYLWLRLLAQGTHNICCVGDDDQSIYGWRGAEVGNILRFEKDFPGATLIRLEQNYRSTPHILAVASKLISHNKGRLGKTLRSAIFHHGEKVKIISAWDDRVEANMVADEIESLQYQLKDKHPLKDVAILVRASFQTRVFEESFLQRAIPYRVIGGLRFYERMEIRDTIAYIRASVQERDDLAFERIINTPKRGIGPSTLQSIYEEARAHACSLIQATKKMVAENRFSPKIQQTLDLFMRQLTQWDQQLHDLPLPEAVYAMLDSSGYLAMWENEKSPDAEGRVENLKELIHALAEFPSVTSFLEHVSLVMEAFENPQENMVTLMTLHGAKGLEFPTVFLPGWEEGLFPHQKALSETGGKGLEEERRLAYVGITRSKQRAYISFCSRRRMYNQYQDCIPSRFLSELPEGHIEPIGMATQLFTKKPVSPAPAYKPPSPSYASPPPRPQGKFSTGMRIFHQKFGYGRILAVQGERLDIAFEKAGTKQIIERFVEAV